MRSKKAQGLPINLIIIAVIALIVLIVVLAITTGKLKTFGKGISNCVARGGSCTGTQEGTGYKCGAGEVYLPGTDCEPNSGCCQKILE